MDFKGITWAGDVYEKFEAMCLEVEEAMYEDTVKYVENQAQKVGVSVKKLYAEVMQDLLPPSCIGPFKVAAAAAELPPEPYTLTDIDEKPKPTCGELNSEQAGVEDICNLTAEDSTLCVCNDAKHRSPRIFVGNARSGLTRQSIGIKRVSHPPKPSRATLCDTRSNLPGASDGPSEAVAEKRPICDASAESCNSDQILLTESVKQERNGSECACPAPDDAMERNSSSHGLPPAPTDAFRRDGSISRIHSNITDTREVGSLGEGATASYEDHFVIEPDNVLEPIEKSELEESCILVEGDELRFVSRGSKKHKSYKKKIYDVLSSKLRPTKKQDPRVSDHEDLRDAGVTSSALAMDRDERKLPAHSSCDFGWELL
ncbi:uncharacterized protein LOC131009168 [Salvia miltiorrhiza]|uniref:uncharacterized protein LOC131009168 n=1 Tax=Salvia miltiorrhiza TaxID=226208 RepID=UPI0025ACF3D5|nr:uncharacterized protein LOC131009168 [Salvia miltiorrhiza]XP_057792382.1 uncharacterized protein LOC131009168 [Salvia miltiorrhiza]XP_057792383.1 uncharacterized protein LOC131009168 [Salvia miltiorrhiza]XP_057792384.1 uncharacterized protein LOC131009168 [Salvia miltiorrhiza]XP_057792385.1 uncharacterized protein LOC131009168 [Salvia miltiorrhiza]XP_057792386.1 uncharacterized protein LOC131009168 [Salvia miltiorrhiza]